MLADSNSLRVVMAQLDFLVGDIQGNIAKIMTAAVDARDRLRADVIVFPELTVTGYPPEGCKFIIFPGEMQTIGKVRTWVVNPVEAQKVLSLTME